MRLGAVALAAIMVAAGCGETADTPAATPGPTPLVLVTANGASREDPFTGNVFSEPFELDTDSTVTLITLPDTWPAVQVIAEGEVEGREIEFIDGQASLDLEAGTYHLMIADPSRLPPWYVQVLLEPGD
jgi:hypothetical protein